METCWNKVKLDWDTLLEMLPKLLSRNGQYLKFGCEPDSATFTIARTKIAGRECWVICDSAEDSPAFVMQCSDTTTGYVDDVMQWLSDNWYWAWDDPVWVSEKVYE